MSTIESIIASPTASIRAVRAGLPAKTFQELSNLLGISNEALAGHLHLSSRTIADKIRKRQRLSREGSEKVLRVKRLHDLARQVFTTDDAANSWMRTPAVALAGDIPLALLDTDPGAREVEQVLYGMIHGNFL